MRNKIASKINEINNAWLTSDFEDFEKYFNEDVVVMFPGLVGSCKGKEQCIDSYKEFSLNANIKDFKAGEPEIDVWGNTAVATCHYSIDYETEGKRYEEDGAEILVFNLDNEDWKIVWRTVMQESVVEY